MHLTRRSRRTVGALIAAAAVAAGCLFGSTAATAATAPPPPARMAALGDSITQASMTCALLYTCPANSWATGTTASVSSQASRLKALNPSLVAYNDAVPGSVSADLPGQAAKAVAQGAQYVTIEIGANDACADTVAAMTTVDAYRTNLQAALNALAASAAHPQIFVASVPSLYHLWDVNKGSLAARLAWATFKECDSMLAKPTSTATADVTRRAQVQQRVDAYNAVLASLCTAAINCRYDGGAVATYMFSKSEVSTIDYFHPSLAGQRTLAAVTWAKTVWVAP